MSILLDLASNIRETSEAIAKHERAFATAPSPALTASLRSLQKRMARLEGEFAALAANSGVDVCRYRFFSEIVRPTIRPVCGALLKFQDLYTLAYDAMKNGVKQIARVTEDTTEQTTFGFGYSFSGSLGIVLTFDNRKIDLFESYMDDAMKAIFSLAKATTSSEVAAMGSVLGGPAIRAAHGWAKEHLQYGLGADIAWVRGPVEKNRLVLDSEQISRFVDALNNTSETRIEPLTLDGMIGGGEHIAKHQFHFVTDDGADIRGSYTDAISESSPVQWPKRYRAHIRKTTKVFYTSEKEDSASYFLERLVPIQ